MSFKSNFDKNHLTCYHHAKRTLPTVSTRKFTAIHKFKGENVTFANLCARCKSTDLKQMTESFCSA